MEHDRLIRRKLNNRDRRRFNVALTPKGRRRFEEVWPQHAAGIGRYFVDPLAQRDIGKLGRILGHLIRANETGIRLEDARGSG